MTPVKLKNMSVNQLVERFAKIALEQDEAQFMDETRKFNRLFLRSKAMEEELKARPGDQRRALIPLYNHPNAQVRFNAAIATLAIAPDAARRALRMISDRQEYPQAADARGMLSALEEGTYKPS